MIYFILFFFKTVVPRLSIQRSSDFWGAPKENKRNVFFVRIKCFIKTLAL